MMGNVSNVTLSDASRLQLLTFINPSLDPLEVGLTRYFGADMPLLQSFEDLLNPYQVGLPCVGYFKRKIFTGRVQTVPTVPQPIIQQTQLVSLNVASVNIDIMNITTVPHIQQQKHSVLPPLTYNRKLAPNNTNTKLNSLAPFTSPLNDNLKFNQHKESNIMMNYQCPQTYFLDNPAQLIKMDDPPILPSLDPTEVEQTLYQRGDAPESLQPQQLSTNQPALVSVTSVNIDTINTPQLQTQSNEVNSVCTYFNPTLNQAQSKAHTKSTQPTRNRTLLREIKHYMMGKAQNLPLPEPLQLLQPLQFQSQSVANIVKERGGPLLQPQPSFQLQTVENIEKERGGPLLPPQTFQPQSVANVAKERDDIDDICGILWVPTASSDATKDVASDIIIIGNALWIPVDAKDISLGPYAVPQPLTFHSYALHSLDPSLDPFAVALPLLLDQFLLGFMLFILAPRTLFILCIFSVVCIVHMYADSHFDWIMSQEESKPKQSESENNDKSNEEKQSEKKVELSYETNANHPLKSRNLSLGQKESISKTVSKEDIIKYAEITGDKNPLHFDEEYAAKTKFGLFLPYLYCQLDMIWKRILMKRIIYFNYGLLIVYRSLLKVMDAKWMILGSQRPLFVFCNFGSHNVCHF